MKSVLFFTCLLLLVLQSDCTAADWIAWNSPTWTNQSSSAWTAPDPGNFTRFTNSSMYFLISAMVRFQYAYLNSYGDLALYCGP